MAEESVEKLICHYTSMEALKGILQKNELCFWGTRYDSMNDPTEYVYAKEFLIPEFCKCFGVKEMDDTEVYPYIVSFCKEKDDFIMWRMYKADVCLILNYDIIDKWVEELNIKDATNTYYFGDCKYPQKEELWDEYKKLKEWNKSRGDESKDEITAFELVTFIKRNCFKNENEVRLFTCDYLLPDFQYNEAEPAKPIIENKERAKDINIRSVRNKDFILYKEFHLPKDALKGLILNCNGVQFDRISQHIRAWLYQQDYNTSTINIQSTKTGDLIVNF